MKNETQFIIKRISALLTVLLLILSVLSMKSDTSLDKFKLSHQYINNDLPTKMLNGVQSIADYDNDGDLDMTIGALNKSFYLLRNNGNEWSIEEMGKVPYTALGTTNLDLNNDGWIDLVAAGVWYENQGGKAFKMIPYDQSFKIGDHFHDVVSADINDDGKMDVVAMGDDIGFFWYDIPDDPMQKWIRTTIDPEYPDWKNHVHGGFSPGGVGDLDGDGDLDVFRANAWFENINKGAEWVNHSLTFPELFTGKLPYGQSTRSVIIDIDNDGDNDIVISECDDVDGKVGIIENIKGDGTQWKLKLLEQKAPGRRGSLHGLQVVDLNMDGKLDIITVDQEDMLEPGMPLPRWFVYTQGNDGWKEKVLFDIGLGGHDFFAKDVDQDGDLDIVSKNWVPWKDNALKGRSHADYFENHVIDQPNGTRLSTDVINDWRKTGGSWKNVGDYIIGGQDENDLKKGGLLLTKEKYGDFELVCDVWIDYGADSGIFLRTDDNSRAYQVTIDYQEGNPMGGVYLSGIEHSVNWDFTIKNENKINGNPGLFDANAWSYIWKKNNWNQFRVKIEGNPAKITVWINGWKVNEYTDTKVRLKNEGYIGLQVHTGNDWAEGKLVRFKNIKVYPR